MATEQRHFIEIKENQLPFLQNALDAKCTFEVLTQVAYDALNPKDATTLYLIVG